MCPKLAKYGILFGEEAGIMNTDTLQKNRTRLLPALCLTRELADRFLEAFAETLKK